MFKYSDVRVVNDMWVCVRNWKPSSYHRFGGESCFGAAYTFSSLSHSFNEWHYILLCDWKNEQCCGVLSQLCISCCLSCVCINIINESRWCGIVWFWVETPNDWQTVGFDRCYRAVEENRKFVYQSVVFRGQQCAQGKTYHVNETVKSRVLTIISFNFLYYGGELCVVHCCHFFLRFKFWFRCVCSRFEVEFPFIARNNNNNKKIDFLKNPMNINVWCALDTFGHQVRVSGGSNEQEC